MPRARPLIRKRNASPTIFAMNDTEKEEAMTEPKQNKNTHRAHTEEHSMKHENKKTSRTKTPMHSTQTHSTQTEEEAMNHEKNKTSHAKTGAHSTQTEEKPMSKTHQTKSTAHETTLSTETAIVAAPAGEATSPPVATPAATSMPKSATAAAATGTDAGSTSSAGSGAAGTGRFVAPPPPPDSAFVPPAGFVPDNAMDFRGVLPRTAELVVLPQAVQDLKKFTDYATVMGSKAPSLAQAIIAFEVTNQWSSARTQADAWDAYARTQEGICWTMLRALMAQLGATYQVAVASDPTMASSLPNLTTLLGAKKTIAHKAVSTKKANAKARAEGKPESHGTVGKRATKTAEKAALAEKLAAEGAAAGQVAPVPQPVVMQAAVPQAAPVPQAASGQAAPAQAGAVVAPALTAATNGVVNGAGH